MSNLLSALKILSKTSYILIAVIPAVVVFVLLVIIFEAVYRRKMDKYNDGLVEEDDDENYDDDEDEEEEVPAKVTETNENRSTVTVQKEVPVYVAGPAVVSTQPANGGNEQLKAQVEALKNEVQSLRYDLVKQNQSSGLRPIFFGFGNEFREIEEELYRAQEQYNYIGTQIQNAKDESEKLDLYIKRISLLEKIMSLNSGFDKLRRMQYQQEPQQRPQSNRLGYYRILDQVRRLNDRIDDMERDRRRRNDDSDYYSGNYRK